MDLDIVVNSVDMWISLWITLKKGEYLVNIKIVCVGKLKEKYLKQGIAEYAKRLSKFL